MKAILVSLAITPVMLTASGQPLGDGADLTAYLQEIRTSGVSEFGKMQLNSVAGICSGATIFEYRLDKESGRYWPSYTSATCPKPGADPPEIEKWKRLTLSDTAMLVGKLKPFADFDASGFVTTQEASDFRWLVEYGYLVAQVIRDEGAKMEFVTRASGKDLTTASRDLARYQDLARKLAGAGITCLPDATVADMQP